jgi:hypothetical protein
MLKYDYEEIKRDLYRVNLAEAKKSTEQPWLILKVHNFSQNFGFREKKVLAKIKKDDIVAANFIKDPGRQNFYENQALAFLNSMNSVRSATKLPAGGSNAQYIIDGKLGHSRDFSRIGENKSIDFEVILEDNSRILLSAKYTKDEGGAQDNQFNDLKNFIKNAEKYPKNDVKFAALADGSYYQTHGRIREMEKLANGKVIVATVENFERKVHE